MTVKKLVAWAIGLVGFVLQLIGVELVLYISPTLGWSLISAGTGLQAGIMLLLAGSLTGTQETAA